MLLEKGEFVQYKGSKAIRWIESVDRHERTIMLGKMEFKDKRYTKTFKLVTWKEFYSKFEDVKQNDK